MLNDTTGPKSGSSSERTTQETPGSAIRCTTNALAASGARRSWSAAYASRSCALEPGRRGCRDSPGWWRISGATDLSTTGSRARRRPRPRPRRCATGTLGHTSMPYAPRSSATSGGVEPPALRRLGEDPFDDASAASRSMPTGTHRHAAVAGPPLGIPGRSGQRAHRVLGHGVGGHGPSCPSSTSSRTGARRPRACRGTLPDKASRPATAASRTAVATSSSRVTNGGMKQVRTLSTSGSAKAAASASANCSPRPRWAATPDRGPPRAPS